MCDSDVSRDKGLFPNELLQSFEGVSLAFLSNGDKLQCRLLFKCYGWQNGCHEGGVMAAAKVVSWPP